MNPYDRGEEGKKESSRRRTVCAKCGHFSSSGSGVCESCGAHLYITCNACGTRNPRAGSRCKQCGHRLHRSVLARWQKKIFRGRLAGMNPVQMLFLVAAVYIGFRVAVTVSQFVTGPGGGVKSLNPRR